MGSNICYQLKYLLEVWMVPIYNMLFKLFNEFMLSLIAILTLYVKSSS